MSLLLIPTLSTADELYTGAECDGGKWECYEYTGQDVGCDEHFISDVTAGEGCTGTCDNWDPQSLTCDNDYDFHFGEGAQYSLTWPGKRNTFGNDPEGPIVGYCLEWDNYHECVVESGCACVSRQSGTECIVDNETLDPVYMYDPVININGHCNYD